MRPVSVMQCFLLLAARRGAAQCGAVQCGAGGPAWCCASAQRHHGFQFLCNSRAGAPGYGPGPGARGLPRAAGGDRWVCVLAGLLNLINQRELSGPSSSCRLFTDHNS